MTTRSRLTRPRAFIALGRLVDVHFPAHGLSPDGVISPFLPHVDARDLRSRNVLTPMARLPGPSSTRAVGQAPRCRPRPEGGAAGDRARRFSAGSRAAA